MKNFILIFVLLIHGYAFSETKCFIATQGAKILVQEGNCKARHSPASTFKIAIALMGYDSEILIDESRPEWPFKEGYVDYIPSWKQAQNPTSWMKYSCVWYSQLLTKQLGMKKFANYAAKFNYGNQDLSGDVGKNNGLTNSWLGSSLQISGLEQTKFLKKLLNDQLPVSQKAHQLTKKILYQEDLGNGWEFYGKTGGGGLPSGKFAWFIGWASPKNSDKASQEIIFAHYIEVPSHETGVATSAKEQAKYKVIQLIG